MAKKNLKINVQKNNETHKGFLCVSSCSLIFIFFCYFCFVTQCNGVCSVQVRDAKGAPCKGYETSRLSLSERCPFVINRAVGTYQDVRPGLHHILANELIQKHSRLLYFLANFIPIRGADYAHLKSFSPPTFF